MKKFFGSRKCRQRGCSIHEMVLCDIVIQVLRSHIAEEVEECFESIVIYVHVLDVIYLVGNVALLAFLGKRGQSYYELSQFLLVELFVY